MSHLDDPADSEMTRQLRDSLPGIGVAGQPALEEILSHGRAHRRRRVLRTTGVGVATVATGTALTFALTGALGGTAAASGAHTTVQAAAFTLTADSNGTDTLTLNNSQVFDPAALQQALAARGIPAVVETLTPSLKTCGFLPTKEFSRVVSFPRGVVTPAQSKMVIDPAAMPAGSELFFMYFDKDHGLVPGLIEKSSYPCSGSSSS